MEPISCHEVKEGSEFIHEIKWDGIRGLIYIQHSDVRLFTKKGNERTDFYPELDSLYNELKQNDLVIDGEMVVVDENGLPNFHDVLVRETVKNKRNLQYYLKNYPIQYMVFDVLQYNGNLLTKQPLIERKNILTEILSPIVAKNNIVRLSEVFDDGKELYQNMKRNNMEGIVSKKKFSHYVEDKKHNEWFKTKFTKRMLCIVGGIQWKDKKPNSLVLGIKTSGTDKLICVGKASLGLKESDLQLLNQYKNELITEECPFDKNTIANISKTGTELTWAYPALTCWISFLELSNEGSLRHPKIIGFAALPIEEANGKVLTD
jgi:bifunctional non-homologous end joining protein LigD